MRYPAMLKASIEEAESGWDMSEPVNRRYVRRMKVRYYLWWKWAPFPSAALGAIVGAMIGLASVAILTR
ncbi:hypothetical protein [Microbacterium sp.]|uniref:hypothetical protein n=1 Tax=Microbacterium sp. TaxID=51671 RepID=UPI0032425A76